MSFSYRNDGQHLPVIDSFPQTTNATWLSELAHLSKDEHAARFPQTFPQYPFLKIHVGYFSVRLNSPFIHAFSNMKSDMFIIFLMQMYEKHFQNEPFERRQATMKEIINGNIFFKFCEQLEDASDGIITGEPLAERTIRFENNSRYWHPCAKSFEHIRTFTKSGSQDVDSLITLLKKEHYNPEEERVFDIPKFFSFICRE